MAGIVVILGGGTVIVYLTGGTKYVWPHLMYFAVVLAGGSFGRRIGIATGAVAGLLMGPLMPLDVALNLSQPTRGWLIRMGFYMAVGALAGYARYRFYRLLDRRRVFVSSVSHELRTPLAAVVGFAGILDQEWDRVSDEERRELISHIVRESNEVAHVVDDLVVAARMDGGRLHVVTEPVDIRAVADSIIATITPRDSHSKVTVDGRAITWADPLRVRQIIRNLLVNAMVYGGDNVIVDIRSATRMVTVTVTDDGVGVPELIVPRLFEPYVNAADPSTTTPQSVGLGLAVSRELARRMGGRLTYERTDQHTVFTLELPPVGERVPPELTRTRLQSSRGQTV